MSMRHAVIINYFLVQKLELKIYYRLLEFCLGLMNCPWYNLSQKSTELTAILMCTIMLIQEKEMYKEAHFFDKSMFSLKNCLQRFG